MQPALLRRGPEALIARSGACRPASSPWSQGTRPRRSRSRAAPAALARSVSPDNAPFSCALTIQRHRGPEPYERFLTSLPVSLTGSKLRIVRTAEELRIAGSAQAPDVLAYNIRFLVRESAGAREARHLHVEHYEGHPCIEPDSEQLIMVWTP